MQQACAHACKCGNKSLSLLETVAAQPRSVRSDCQSAKLVIVYVMLNCFFVVNFLTRTR